MSFGEYKLNTLVSILDELGTTSLVSPNDSVNSFENSLMTSLLCL